MTALQDRRAPDPAVVRSDCNCALGKWLHSDGKQHSRLKEYGSLLECHKEFHKAAASVVDLINLDRLDAAKASLETGAFKKQSRIAVAAIDDLRNALAGKRSRRQTVLDEMPISKKVAFGIVLVILVALAASGLLVYEIKALGLGSQEVETLQALAALGTASIAVALAALGWWITSAITTPIVELTQTMLKLERGEESSRGAIDPATRRDRRTGRSGAGLQGRRFREASGRHGSGRPARRCGRGARTQRAGSARGDSARAGDRRRIDRRGSRQAGGEGPDLSDVVGHTRGLSQAAIGFQCGDRPARRSDAGRDRQHERDPVGNAWRYRRAADDLSQRTEQQAASLEETAAALHEITATVEKSAEGATPRPPGRRRRQRRRQEERGGGASGGRGDGRHREVGAADQPDHRRDRRDRVPDQSARPQRRRRGGAGGRRRPRLRGRRLRSARARPALGRSGQGDQGPDFGLDDAGRSRRQAGRPKPARRSSGSSPR